LTGAQSAATDDGAAKPRDPQGIPGRRVAVGQVRALTRTPRQQRTCLARLRHDERVSPWENVGEAMPSSEERPTLHPKFDMEEYARESDQRVRSADPASGIQPAEREAVVEASEDVDDEDAERIYWACLGDAARVPVLVQRHDELVTHPRTALESFVISYVDGQRTIAEVIEASGLPSLAGLTALYDLLGRELIALRDPR
jgi:hypothetical protein